MRRFLAITIAVCAALGIGGAVSAQSSTAELHPSVVFQQDTFTPSDCFARFEGDLASSFCANGPGKQRVEANCTGGGKVEGPYVVSGTSSFVACITNVASVRTGKVSPYVP